MPPSKTNSRSAITLDYGGPFDVGAMLKYLGRDPESLCEKTSGTRFERYIPLHEKPAHLLLEFERTRTQCVFRRKLSPEERRTAGKLVPHMLGLDQPLDKFYRLARKQAALAPIVERHHGARIPRLPDLWESLCWAVLGQQINLAFAYRLRNRLIQAANPRSGEKPGMEIIGPPRNVRSFPTPVQVLAVSPALLRRRQFSGAKITYLRELARAFQGGLARDVPGPGEVASADHARVFRETLLAVKGLGPWSVDYALMRCGGYLDALPIGDAGLRAALKKAFRLKHAPNPAEQEKLMEAFRPYRSLATYYLWKSLEP